MPVITNHHQHGEDDDGNDDDGPTAPPTSCRERKSICSAFHDDYEREEIPSNSFPLNSWKRPFLGQAAPVCCKTGQATCFGELQCMLHVDVLKDVVVYE